MLFKTVHGTKDILPRETILWQAVEEESRKLFSLYGYKEIRTPILEERSLFQRSLGKDTEIVEKQMFLINRDRDFFVLRPEATAGIVRAYLENSLDKTNGFIKIYYIGPMFRAERPQKGRLRQFHHLGCEAIGSNSPYLDAEVISLADRILRGLFITGYQIKINNLGCIEDKSKLTLNLKKKLKGKTKYLCSDCQKRYTRNVFRILDCKNQGCKNFIRSLDLKEGYACLKCQGFFKEVKKHLDSLEINYEIDPYLVRGLDYYTRTVFEIRHPSLGSQDALGAGGRYDNLVKELGGPLQGAIGFAFGIERLLLVMPRPKLDIRPDVYIVTLNSQAKEKGFLLLNQLRNNGISSDLDYEDKSLKAQMRQANKLNTRFVAILGEDELRKNVVTLKDMTSGHQREVKSEDLINELKTNVRIPVCRETDKVK